MKKIKVLTVSNTAWSNQNSFGITYNALFDGLDDIFEFANIYCNYGVPENNCVTKYCQITEKSIIARLRNKKDEMCCIFDAENAVENALCLDCAESNKYKNIKKRRLQLSLWARDLVWKKGLKDMSAIIDFVNEFKPDIIFTPMYYMFHTNRILQVVIKTANVPVIAYISDDIYRTEKFICSPLYAVDRLFKRRTLRRSISMCDMLYVACESQKNEYEKIFGKLCKVLVKPAEDISVALSAEKDSNKRIFVYAGNLGTKRWKTVVQVGRSVSQNGGVLRVFSATPVTKRIGKIFEKSGIDFRGAVRSDVASLECANADVLLYAEGFDKMSASLTKYSVSTKIPTYLLNGKLILAVGSDKIEIIKYLSDHNAAIVATQRCDIATAVKASMKDDLNLIKNARECAENDFNKAEIQKILKSDILSFAGKRGEPI
ncbi:MAG: glycosyltransferase family 4 protein [Ruminococcaceae bacterium]|nr:glycosyltransferase family 4 protein [Oscillospiraceae bacterium]